MVDLVQHAKRIDHCGDIGKPQRNAAVGRIKDNVTILRAPRRALEFRSKVFHQVLALEH